MSWMVRAGLILLATRLGLTSCGTSPHGPDHASEVDASPQMNPTSEASLCVIQTSNYDHSCTVDTDCVGTAGQFPIQSGNYCQADCFCGGDAISVKAIARYVQDVSMTPVGSGAIRVICACGMVAPPCCANGNCTTVCPPPPSFDDAASPQDAEVVPPGSIMCSLNAGPFDAGTDAGGPWRWCAPPATCVPFNGAWACCQMPASPGGPTICSAPVANDTGGP